MMVPMEIALVICLVAAVAALTWLVARRGVAAVEPAPAPVVSADVISQAAMLAVEQAITMSREQLGAHTQASDASLAGRQQLIDQRLAEVQSVVHLDIDRLSTLVQQLGEATSERFGQVDRSLQVHSEITQTLSSTTNSLREALASSNARGQWGERMAEDVLRLAGFHEGVNYHKRTGVVGEGRGIPDFTFLLPRGHVLFMDVKFPMAAYLKYLDATTDAERSAHRATFVRDVRARVRELARREYAATDDRSTIDNVLLFVPNETVSAFIHESDFGLIEEAMASNVVICSPLTLFAFLGVIRQAFDNFVIEETSQEILQLLGKFGQQWGKYTEQVDKVKRSFDTLNRSFDELATTRRRQLERPLNAIEDLRRKQRLPIDEQLFGIDETGEVETELDNVRELGA